MALASTEIMSGWSAPDVSTTPPSMAVTTQLVEFRWSCVLPDPGGRLVVADV